ncbi:hypothetical protein [Roseomonas populi]|uniref:Alpha/beta hydrolase n=1 Tax=Roseomonas populi TaxID=3121582 RepID=A0ABT1X463_9PROT|nr:hypothetical protein [Roseomonas pecuniae]MCR0982886.1 hypothetical protein [Roseomonas pecuniae]
MLRALPGDPAKPTIVTFGDAQQRPEAGGFWGEAVVARMGWPGFGFVARRPNWFPAASVEAAAGALRGRLGPIAVGYGFSMGGYSALKYGRRLGLSHALALSPQASIAPGDVPRDHRYRAFYSPALHRDMRVRPGDAPPVSWAVYDPLQGDDAANIALLAQPGLRPVPIRGIYHGTIRLLAGQAELEAGLRALLAEDMPALRRLLRERRRAMPASRGVLGAARLGQGRVAAGEALLEVARQKGMSAAEEVDALAQAVADWQVHGGAGAAAALRARLLQLRDLPAGRPYHVRGNALLALGAPEEALDSFRHAEAGGVGPMALRGQRRAARALWFRRAGALRWPLRPLLWAAALIQVEAGRRLPAFRRKGRG